MNDVQLINFRELIWDESDPDNPFLTPGDAFVDIPLRACLQLDYSTQVNAPVVDHLTMSGKTLRQMLAWKKLTISISGGGTEDPQLWRLDYAKQYSVSVTQPHRRVIKAIPNQAYGLMTQAEFTTETGITELNGLDLSINPDHLIQVFVPVDPFATDYRREANALPYSVATNFSGAKVQGEAWVVDENSNLEKRGILWGDATNLDYIEYRYTPVYWVNVKPWADPQYTDRGSRSYTWTLDVETL
jgi:hypothetical protein